VQLLLPLPAATAPGLVPMPLVPPSATSASSSAMLCCVLGNCLSRMVTPPSVMDVRDGP
jgi:hypothetical protein